MVKNILSIVLVESNDDDLAIFQKALKEVKIKTKVDTFHSGIELMGYLAKVDGKIPDIIFLSLPLPYKSAIECLEEIRANKRLRDISVIIYSKSVTDEKDIEETFLKGANIYIRMTHNYEDLKKAISHVLSIDWQYHASRLNKDNYILVI